MISEFLMRTVSAVILIGCFFIAYLHSMALFTYTLLAALLIMLVFEWPSLIDSTSKISFIVISLFYPIAPMFGLIILNACFRPADMLLPLYPFVISWIYDTMGYLVGKMVGYHKICPNISPGKTWEWLVGSFIGVFIGNVCFLQRITVEPFYQITTRFTSMLIYSMLLTLTAFSGGMMLSYLKRRKGLKDAGSLLPGHGGLLDRFDSIFFVGMFVWGVILVELFR